MSTDDNSCPDDDDGEDADDDGDDEDADGDDADDQHVDDAIGAEYEDDEDGVSKPTFSMDINRQG